MDGLTSTPAQAWLARLSFALAGLAIVSLVVVAGLKSLAMVALGRAASDWARLRYLAGIRNLRRGHRIDRR